MMRPVILSRPENTAVGLAMRCGGGSTTTSSEGGGPFASCGAPGGDGCWPGGVLACCGCCCGCGRCSAGACCAPGGGARSCDWIDPPPGRFCGGRLIGGGIGCAGGTSPRCTLPGGRGAFGSYWSCV